MSTSTLLTVHSLARQLERTYGWHRGTFVLKGEASSAVADAADEEDNGEAEGIGPAPAARPRAGRRDAAQLVRGEVRGQQRARNVDAAQRAGEEGEDRPPKGRKKQKAPKKNFRNQP